MTAEIIATSVSSNKAKLTVRFLLGGLYIVFGLNGFLHFLPTPTPTPEGGALLGAFFKAGYMFPFIKITEILGGALLVAGWTSLGAVILLPITLNILAYHLFLDQSGMVLTIAILAMNLALGWFNREAYKSLFIKG